MSVDLQQAEATINYIDSWWKSLATAYPNSNSQFRQDVQTLLELSRSLLSRCRHLEKVICEFINDDSINVVMSSVDSLGRYEALCDVVEGTNES